MSQSPHPALGLGSLLSLLASVSASGPLRGPSGNSGGRWWPWALRWPRPDSGSAWGRGLETAGVSRALLSFPGLRPWPQTNVTLPLLPLSWHHTWGCALFCVRWFHMREAHLVNKARQTEGGSCAFCSPHSPRSVNCLVCMESMRQSGPVSLLARLRKGHGNPGSQFQSRGPRPPGLRPQT